MQKFYVNDYIVLSERVVSRVLIMVLTDRALFRVLFRVLCDLVLLGPWVSVWSSVHFFRYAKIQNIILKLNFIDLLLNLLPIFLFTNNFVLMFILDFTLTHKKIICSDHSLMIAVVMVKYTLIIAVTVAISRMSSILWHTIIGLSETP